jgi:hypothetical protein
VFQLKLMQLNMRSAQGGHLNSLNSVL